jgi:phospholipase C
MTAGPAGLAALTVRALAAGGMVGGLLLGAAGAAVAAPSSGPQVPTTPIEHFVFLMQENHSFDNYFGTRPGVDGIPEGTCMPRNPDDPSLGCVEPFPIRDQGITDLDHTEGAFLEQYNEGAMDGFVWANERRGHDGSLAMGYYDDQDLPFYWNVADEYVLFDRFFTSSKSGSVRNHMYRVTGHPGATGKGESIPAEGWGDIPTIFDRLQEAGVSWKFYVQNYDPQINFRTRLLQESGDRAAQVIWVPLLAYARYIDDPELNSHIVDLDQFYEDAANGTLPAVAYIAPSGNSEHPPGSVRAGQRLVRGLIGTLMRSTAWESSAFLWSYDDWGGWYDHVVPPQVDEYGYGFRAPALLVSPYAKRGYVDSTTLDFTSALKFIQLNWGLEPLAERDRNAETFMGAFDFDSPPREPVVLSTARNVVPDPRPDAVPVYGLYAAAVVLVFGLMALASRRTRPAAAPPDLSADGLIGVTS